MRVDLSDASDVCAVSVGLEPLHHRRCDEEHYASAADRDFGTSTLTKLPVHAQNDPRDEPKGKQQRLASRLLILGLELVERVRATGQTDRLIAINRCVAMEEGLGPKEPDVRDRDELEWLGDGLLPDGHEDLAKKVIGIVVKEGDRPEDDVRHARLLSALDEILFDAVLVRKVGDNRGVRIRLGVSAPIDRRVDKVLDLVCYCRTDKRLALLFLPFNGFALVHARAHAKDSPDRHGDRCKDGIGVVKVCLDDMHSG